MKPLHRILLVLAAPVLPLIGAPVSACGDELGAPRTGAPTTWTMTETTAKASQAIHYRLEKDGDRSVLTCERPKGAVVTVFDAQGNTLSWTRQNQGGTLELSRVGGDLVVHRGIETSRFPAASLPWIQDLNQLSAFVVGPETKLRFVGFASFLDARLQASDMTTFVATKVGREVQKWGSGQGETWKVRVTFDDLRSAFWGAWYWFRLSDGRLVRTEEVRGAPGTPVTVSVLEES